MMNELERAEREKNKCRDVVLILRGWYDKEKYKSIFDALRAYQAVITIMDATRLSYSDVMSFLVLPACKQYLNVDDLCGFIADLTRTIVFNCEGKQSIEVTADILLIKVGCLFMRLTRDDLGIPMDQEIHNVI